MSYSFEEKKKTKNEIIIPYLHATPWPSDNDTCLTIIIIIIIKYHHLGRIMCRDIYLSISTVTVLLYDS